MLGKAPTTGFMGLSLAGLPTVCRAQGQAESTESLNSSPPIERSLCYANIELLSTIPPFERSLSSNNTCFVSPTPLARSSVKSQKYFLEVPKVEEKPEHISYPSLGLGILCVISVWGHARWGIRTPHEARKRPNRKRRAVRQQRRVGEPASPIAKGTRLSEPHSTRGPVRGPMFDPGHFDPFVGGANPVPAPVAGSDTDGIAKAVNAMMDLMKGQMEQLALLSRQVANVGKARPLPPKRTWNIEGWYDYPDGTWKWPEDEEVDDDEEQGEAQVSGAEHPDQEEEAEERKSSKKLEASAKRKAKKDQWDELSAKLSLWDIVYPIAWRLATVQDEKHTEDSLKKLQAVHSRYLSGKLSRKDKEAAIQAKTEDPSALAKKPAPWGAGKPKEETHKAKAKAKAAPKAAAPAPRKAANWTAFADHGALARTLMEVVDQDFPDLPATKARGGLEDTHPQQKNLKVVNLAWDAKVTSLLHADSSRKGDRLVLVSRTAEETDNCVEWATARSNLEHTTIVQLEDFDDEDTRVREVLVSEKTRQFPKRVLVYPLSGTSPTPAFGGSANLAAADIAPRGGLVAVRFQIIKAFNPALYAKAVRATGEACPNLIFEDNKEKLANIKHRLSHSVLKDAATCLAKVPVEVAEDWLTNNPNPMKGTFVSISPERGAPKIPEDRFTPIVRPPVG